MKRSVQTAVGIGLVAGFSCASHGALADPSSSLASAPLADSGVSVLRVAGALALVVGLFLGGVWGFKNWQRVLWRSKGSPKLNVIEVRPLGGRHALYLVGYDQQRLLLAASPTGVQFITHLPDAGPGSTAAPDPSAFARALDGVQDPGAPGLSPANDRH